MSFPAVLVTEIVAEGNSQVDESFFVRVNFTGITPLEELKMILPSALLAVARTPCTGCLE